MRNTTVGSLLLAALVVAPWGLEPDGEDLLIDPAMHHLGDDSTPEWPEAPAEPSAGPLVWNFRLAAVDGDRVLALRQRHVSDRWRLVLNGATLAELRRHDDLREELHAVPAGLLRVGGNRLELVGDAPGDDITVGEVRLLAGSLAEVLDLTTLVVRVREAPDGGPLPARITIVGPDDEPAELYVADERLAVRPGVVYSAHGEARVQLPRGRYEVWALRGTEWSRDRTAVELSGGRAEVDLELRREVETPGVVAVDTHIHTLTFSGHGDASLEERQITLAGEGVELAIATDHNHNTDYAAASARLGTASFFTPVVGNEVTTPIGHFNAFPLEAGAERPPHDLHDWLATVDGMRDAGARVVILNHPRWPAFDTGPFGVEGLDRATGARASGAPFTFDAMELVNSTTEEADPMVLIEDWFALLNRGERVLGVGSSDSHTVGDPVGQGRTYVACGADDPGAIDVDEVADALLAGQASVSLGIVSDLRVDGRHGMGELVPAADRSVDVSVRVAAPSWVRPERLELYRNGTQVHAQQLASVDGPLDTWIDVTVPLPSHDAWLVAVVHGAPLDGPAWPSLNDYTLAITNPVWCDVDGGGWQAPRQVGLETLERAIGAGSETDPRSLGALDDAALVHYLDGLRTHLHRRADAAVRGLGQQRSDPDRALDELLERLR